MSCRRTAPSGTGAATARARDSRALEGSPRTLSGHELQPASRPLHRPRRRCPAPSWPSVHCSQDLRRAGCRCRMPRSQPCFLRGQRQRPKSRPLLQAEGASAPAARVDVELARALPSLRFPPCVESRLTTEGDWSSRPPSRETSLRARCCRRAIKRLGLSCQCRGRDSNPHAPRENLILSPSCFVAAGLQLAGESRLTGLADPDSCSQGGRRSARPELEDDPDSDSVPAGRQFQERGERPLQGSSRHGLS